MSVPRSGDGVIKEPEAMSRLQAPLWDHRSLSSPFWNKLKLLHNLEALEEAGGWGGGVVCKMTELEPKEASELPSGAFIGDLIKNLVVTKTKTYI